MHTVPGIHVATGYFNASGAAHRLPPDPSRFRVSARLGDWLSAVLDSRYEPACTRADHPSGVTVLLDGYLTGVGNTKSPAATVLAGYLDRELETFLGLHGSFTGIVLDARSNSAHVFNDRRASRPVFYRDRGDQSLLVGPEVSRLAAATPALLEIDPVAVVEFVLFASYYDDRTLFPQVKTLPPGVVLTLQPERVSVLRYWQLAIEPIKNPRAEAETLEELIHQFDRATRGLMAGRSKPFLFLSGGVDSRVIAGALRSADIVMPAVTYGTDEGDDATAARRIADLCGMSLIYHPIPAAGLEAHFEDAATRSDCRAATVDTPTHGPLLDELSEKFGTFLQGDKSFYGRNANSHDDAFTICGIYTLRHAPLLADMLEPAVSQCVGAELERCVAAMRSAGSALQPQDFKDKIYFEQRLANRQNAFTAANLRQFEQVRPWLDEDIVDLLFAMPSELRVDKVFNRNMLERKWPDLLAVPFSTRDSIPSPAYYRKALPAQPALADFVREQFGASLDARLAAMFRPRVLEALVESLVRGESYPFIPVRWWERLPGAWRLIAARYRGGRLHPVKIMQRLMQINLYLRALSKPVDVYQLGGGAMRND